MTEANKIIERGSLQSQQVLEPARLQAVSQLMEKIALLQQRLQSALPGYESILHQIHQVLATDEAMTHMLTEDQIGIIISGLTRHKQVILAEAAKPTRKALSKTTEEDL